MAGLLIALEGPDGCGKTTQIELLKDRLEKEGFEVIVTREPGGTKISEKIREILLDNDNNEMGSCCEALLYAASRAQLVAQVIKPNLAEGKVVVCDRFVDSSIAYQGYGRQLGDSVEVINSYAVAGCMPDLTILMKLDPSVGKNRIWSRDKDRLELEKDAFHTAVFEGYLALEKKYSDRIIGIDASRTIEDIKGDIYMKLEEVLQRVSE